MPTYLDTTKCFLMFLSHFAWVNVKREREIKNEKKIDETLTKIGNPKNFK